MNAVNRWFTSNHDWLLILDNADDLGMAREFIPAGKNGHVLLTTRASAVGTMARRVEIQEMGTEEGALCILRRVKAIAEDASLDAAAEADQATAKEIATQLDGLPLALDQGGAYIEETACGLSGYLDLYRKHAPILLQRRGVLASDHPDSVDKTWVLSFENIEQANPAAAEILRFCAFLDPDGIPEEVFSEGAPALGPQLERLGSDALALNGAISEILKYSLLRRDPNNHTLEIHRLVQAVLRQGMDESTQRLWAERAVRAIALTFPTPGYSNWALCERMLAQAHACAELIDQWRLEFPAAARLLNHTGFYSRERGRYADAEPLCRRALAIREKALGPEHPDVATSLNNLAQVYHVQGRYPEAEPLDQRALAIREKVLGPEHPDVATSLNDLACIYHHQGRYSEAEGLHQRSLAIRQKVLGPEHPDVATSLNNLAWIYYHQDRYAEAEPLQQRALSIQEKALGPEHPDVATSLSNLAWIYYQQGRHAESEPLYQRALSIQEKALGPRHPVVAGTLNCLTLLYESQGRHAQAEPLYQRALAIEEKALGPEHPDVATSLNDLAWIYYQQGRYAQAEPLYQRALAISEKTLGSERPDVAASLNNLAALYRAQGRYAEAHPLYQRALAIWEKVLGPDHPDLATNLHDLALFYGNQGLYSEARPLYQRALAIWEKVLGPDHPYVATCFENYASLLRKTGRRAEAQVTSSPPQWVYVIGQIQVCHPSAGLEKETQAKGRTNTADLTDQQTLQRVLQENRCLARQECYVLLVQGLEAYLLVARDPQEYALLIAAVRSSPSPTDLDVVIGVRGPIASADMCNGLRVPILYFDQIYSFDRVSFLQSIPRPEDVEAGKFMAVAEEVFDRIMLQTDNAGATDEHRAMNYLA